MTTFDGCEMSIPLIISIVLVLSLVFDVIRRSYLSPHRTFYAWLLDSICSIPMALKVGPWSKPHGIHASIQEAINNTGLTDFGGKDKTTFIERYDTAIKLGLKRSKAVFSPAGIAFVKGVIVRRMTSRLNFFNYLKKHKSIEETPLKSPIFIIGFPRTGTTFLHELLGLHPDVRMHYSWEQMDMVPSTDDESIAAQELDRKKRYNKNKFYFNLVFSLGGEAIQSIHRIGYDESEECTTPCALELPYTVPELPLYIYASPEVIAMKGAGEAFEHYRSILKLLTWQCQDRRGKDFTWMLKCPFHLPYIDELYASFPGATVVWTHRDPVDCIASACSLYETLMRMSMEEYSIDKEALGQAVLKYTRLALDMAMASLEKMKNKVKVIHVRYADNVKNSKAVCKDICEQAGLSYSDFYEGELDRYLAKNAEKRKKLKSKKDNKSADLHVYKLEDYGLSKEIVNGMFSDYTSQFRLSEK